MKKIISLAIMFVCFMQTISYAETEFVFGNSPDYEGTKIVDEEIGLRATIFEINGTSYVYRKFDEFTNPVPYNEGLKEIIGKAYIITDDYYIAFDCENIGALGYGAYIPHTTLMFYDKQMNLIHEEDFGGGVCIRDVGYCNGVFYCKYSEKIKTVIDETGVHYERDYNQNIDRNSTSEKIEDITVKSTDMVNWVKCNDGIPISNSQSCIFGNKISLYENEPMNVIYENDTNYELPKYYNKFGDWFVAYELDTNRQFIENIYISNDFVYFVPIDMTEETKNHIKDSHINDISRIYEFSQEIIVRFDAKHYLKFSAEDLYNKLNGMKNSPYVQFQDEILGFKTPPIIEDGSTLVPMRFLFEQMGADVEWNQEAQTATAILNNTAVTFSINDTEASVNNTPVTMNVPARLVNNKTMVPLRFLSEEMGYTVIWDERTRMVFIE